MAVLRNAISGEIIASRVERARSWLQRSVGFLFRDYVAPDEGLWFERCSAIHTLGMRARIDVIFIDAQKSVLSVYSDVPTGRWAVGCRTARAVIELGSGASREVQIAPGDLLELVADANTPT